MALGLMPFGLVLLVVAALAALSPPESRMAGFATSLSGRTPAQRHNARLAARSLNGARIPAGGLFSFNGTVQTWSLDRGYVRAPVSYDGSLVPAFGGGVCQTSTALYNAALLAGMAITERHHHVFAPHYVPPGRDAAVAYPNIDLRFRNPYPFPVRLRSSVDGDILRVEMWGRTDTRTEYQLVTRVLSASPPETVRRTVPRKAGKPAVARYAGIGGFRVVTYRVARKNGREVRRERLSDDAYPSMPNILAFAE
ncbi:MAG: VanW family protein [Capsulimonadales bacterium]|nr:VanW family protein [Capsulimonadales bacterium]